MAFSSAGAKSRPRLSARRAGCTLCVSLVLVGCTSGQDTSRSYRLGEASPTALVLTASPPVFKADHDVTFTVERNGVPTGEREHQFVMLQKREGGTWVDRFRVWPAVFEVPGRMEPSETPVQGEIATNAGSSMTTRIGRLPKADWRVQLGVVMEDGHIETIWRRLKGT